MSYRDQSPVKDRLTVLEQVYHQALGQQPEGVELSFSRNLASTEQIYQRKLKVGEAWQRLDFGWIEQPGMIVVKNEEGQFPHRIPTEEEKEDAAKRVLEVGSRESADWLVLPQESFRGQPANPVFVRSRHQETRIVVYVFPS